jgi:hypothetical protein
MAGVECGRPVGLTAATRAQVITGKGAAAIEGGVVHSLLTQVKTESAPINTDISDVTLRYPNSKISAKGAIMVTPGLVESSS